MGHDKRRIETGCVNRSGFDLQDKMIINQIMLRYRPIAPRPVSVDSTAGLVPVKTKRAKRKYVRVKKKNKKVGEECNFGNMTVKSLDQTVAMRLVTGGSEFVTDPVRKVSVPDQLISFDVSGNNNIKRWITQDVVGLHDVDLERRMTSRPLVESWITMESVIGTCEDENKLGYTDEEIWKDLDTDNCPGFISSGSDEVQWVNLAYRRMVDPDTENQGAQGAHVVVWLTSKAEKSAFEYWPAFSCRVRVVYMLSEKKKQMTVPCDVWKMDSGAYAWRLDVKAALCLGRLN